MISNAQDIINKINNGKKVVSSFEEVIKFMMICRNKKLVGKIRIDLNDDNTALLTKQKES